MAKMLLVMILITNAIVSGEIKSLCLQLVFLSAKDFKCRSEVTRCRKGTERKLTLTCPHLQMRFNESLSVGNTYELLRGCSAKQIYFISCFQALFTMSVGS